MKYLDLAIANEQINPVDIKGKSYSEVNQRIKAFRMIYPEGKIETNMISNENGVCIFKAYIYDNKGHMLGTGTAYEKEDSSFINQTSYIENCETSAVGRALGMCGFGIDTSVASAEEVANAIQNQVITQEDADNYKLKFGKHKGKLLKDVYKDDPNYIDWIINNTQDEQILEVIRLATGLHIPSIIEQKERTELIAKVMELDIDQIKEDYEIDNIRQLTDEQLKEVIECKKYM